MVKIHFLGLLLSVFLGLPTEADEWATYRGDSRRSGTTSLELDIGHLDLAWSWTSAWRPASAWPDAARWDAYAKLDGLRSMRDYDPVFHPVVVGDRLLFANNTNDTVECFNLGTGERLWRFFCEAPVRIAPSVYEGHTYFGADDGCVRCVRLEDGTLIWKKELVPNTRQFVNDGRLCSFQAVRTGVVFDPEHATVIAGCGLFPWKDSHLFGLELGSGEQVWHQELGTGWTIEGPMLLGSKHIIAPQGRAAPQLFNREDGKPAGSLSGGGGAFALITESDQVFHGPGNKGGWISGSDSTTKERIALFDKSFAAVIGEDFAFSLDPGGVTATTRQNSQPIWRCKLRTPCEIVATPSLVFVGGHDYVAGIDRKSGAVVWAERVQGRAIGLAIGDQCLVVSTDSGQISVFRESTNNRRLDPQLLDFLEWEPLAIESELPVNSQAQTPAVSSDPDLLQRWLFHQNVLQDGSLSSLAHNGLRLKLPPTAQFRQVNEEHYWVLDGSQDSQVAPSFRDVVAPEEAISVVATVRVDKPQSWGGLLSMSQDNGSYERGWILGFQKDRFGFAINGTKSDDKLGWVLAKNAFHGGQWYHVVGVYNGLVTQLYINGKLSSEGHSQKGPIWYPDQAAFHLGSYKDDDEHFYTQGRLNEIALYRRALSAAEIEQLFQERQAALELIASPSLNRETDASQQRPYRVTVNSNLDLSRGPEFQFVEPGKARVSWRTASPSTPSSLLIVAGEATASTTQVGEEGLSVATISGVEPFETVRFQIRSSDEQGTRLSKEYECDGHFDYSRRSVVPMSSADSAWCKLAEEVWTAQNRPRSGMAAVIGFVDGGSVATELSSRLGLNVTVYQREAGDLAEARTSLAESNLYGRPVNVQKAAMLADAPDSIFNFVIMGPEEFDAEFSKLAFEKLQPRGIALVPQELSPNLVAELRMARLPADRTESRSRGGAETGDEPFVAYQLPSKPGTAGWTHMYGLPDNSAFAGEELQGASRIDQLDVTWAGRPGPRYQSDRGNRKPSPLASNGKLFLQGLHRLIGLDAHNGSILWSWELPELTRFNVPRDCSNWCAAGEDLFVACQDHCKVLDASTGKIKKEFPVVKLGDSAMNWGFVARQNDLLIGSSVAPEASFTEFWGGEFWYDAKDGELASKVCSDILFAVDPESGAQLWAYSGSLIVNSTISMQGNRIVFVESRSKNLIAAENRRLQGDEFWGTLFVVCLDANTGQLIWEQPAKPMPGVAAFYGVCTRDAYLLQSSSAGYFALYSMSLEDGEMQWRGKHDWEADHHGKHLSRPAVVGDRIYLRPLTLDRLTGDVLSKRFPVGHQCGTYTASSKALFLRAGNLTMWDGNSVDATRWERLRPDCWISTIPAEGMLLSPEGGGGCSCGGWIETSIGFGVVKDDG